MGKKNILYWKEKKNEQDGKGCYNIGVDKKMLKDFKDKWTL